MGKDLTKDVNRRIGITAKIPRFLTETPFEWLVSVTFTLSALSALSGSSTGSLQRIAPYWLVILWAVVMLLGGVSLFIGLTWRMIELQRQGYGLLCMGSVIYGSAVVGIAGSKTPFITAAVYALIAGVCGLRRFQLTTLHKIAEFRVKNRVGDGDGE